MKVAITGGTGLVGTALVEELDNLGIDYIILSRQTSKNNKIMSTNYSKQSLLKILKDCDSLVHLAANRGPTSQIESFHNDESITQNIYDVCVELDIKNIVFASSISVYSDVNNLAWKEKQTANPVSMYGISKLSCEMIGNIYSKKHNLKIKNFRFAHLFGKNEQNNYMINLFMRKAFNNEELTLDTQSTAKREFLYVQDAAIAIVKGLKNRKISGTYNIGSNIRLTNYEVAKYINVAFQNNNNMKILNADLKDSSSSSYMENYKAKKELNFEATYKFTEALEEIYYHMKGKENVPIFY